MTDKITLASINNISNQPVTAAANINANNATLIGAIDNTLSRIGQAPNQMASILDMNSNQIINLPPPASLNSPARLADIVSATTSIASVPAVGTSGGVVGLLNSNNVYSGSPPFTLLEAGGASPAASGYAAVYANSIFHNLQVLGGGASAVGSNTVIPFNPVPNFYVTGITSSGVITIAQPSASSLTNGVVGSGPVVLANGATMYGTTFSGPFIISQGGGATAGPWVDIRAFGASTNSLIDQGPVIQAAINSLTSFGGGIVYIPAGDWKVQTGITVTNATILQGAGNTLSVIDSLSTEIVPVTFLSACVNAGLRDLAVYGHQSATSVKPAVQVNANALVNIRDCNLWFGSAGISSAGVDGLCTNSYISGYTSAASIVNGASWWIRCKFDIAGGIVSTNAVFLSSLSSASPVENLFVGCDLSGAYTYSINIADTGTPNSLAKFVGCVFSSPISVSACRWISLDSCELGSATVALGASGGVITVASCYGFASTVISITGTATKYVAACYQIS